MLARLAQHIKGYYYPGTSTITRQRTHQSELEVQTDESSASQSKLEIQTDEASTSQSEYQISVAVTKTAQAAFVIWNPDEVIN